MAMLGEAQGRVAADDVESLNGHRPEKRNSGPVIELLLGAGITGEGSKPGISHQGNSLVISLQEGANPNRNTISQIAQMVPAEVYAIRVFQSGELVVTDENMTHHSKGSEEPPPTVYIDGKIVSHRTAKRRAGRSKDLLSARIEEQGSPIIVQTRSDGWKTRWRPYRRGVDSRVSSNPRRRA